MKVRMFLLNIKTFIIIGNMPMDINTICRRAELPIQDVSEQLTMLELNEYIRALPGDMFVKV